MIQQDYKKHLGFFLTLSAIALFVPGIILPMFTLSMDMLVNVAGAGFNSELIDKELSILNTVSELLQDDRILVAVLIFVFSALIPISKAILLCIAYFIKTASHQKQISNFVSVIGKWSMADVFVVAVFLAVLSTNHTESAQQHELSFFGMSFAFELSSQTLSNVGLGFYYFVSYCIVSLVGSQLMLSAFSKVKDEGKQAGDV